MTEIKFLQRPDSDKEGRSAVEWIDEFKRFLMKVPPDGVYLKKECQPNMSAEQAETVIWYLQEILPVLPNNIDCCSHCGHVYDSYEEGEYCEKTGKDYCDNCLYLAPEDCEEEV